MQAYIQHLETNQPSAEAMRGDCTAALVFQRSVRMRAEEQMGNMTLHLARMLVCAYAVSSMLESYAPALHAEKTMSRPSRAGGW